MGRRKWSRADIDRLFDMRDVQDLMWGQIGEAFGDTGANCCTRYKYYKTKRHIEAIRRGDAEPGSLPLLSRRSQQQRPKTRKAARPKVLARKPKAAALPPPKPAPRAEPVVHRPRYFHEADADIAARIRRQGLTAGFLGDPPPGRSALDQKMQGMT